MQLPNESQNRPQNPQVPLCPFGLCSWGKRVVISNSRKLTADPRLEGSFRGWQHLPWQWKLSGDLP